MNSEKMWEEKMRSICGWMAAIGVVLFSLVFFGRVAWLAIDQEYWKGIGLKHFATIVGLPAAAIASAFLVLSLRTVSGPLEFKALGFEFKGSSGPIAFWVVCFLAITVAIRLTWPMTFIKPLCT